MPAYTRQYTQDVGWENEPSTATPINAANLNKMDDAIGAIDAELAALFGNGIIDRNSYATVAQAGLVKPDGRTITVDSDGEIHATGGGGGASALDDLTDTDITDPATGEVLTYNGTSGKWENEALPVPKGMEKTQYAVPVTGWSGPDANGYYTNSITLSTALDTTYAPNIYNASTDDADAANFDLLEYAELTASTTLVLYASATPTGSAFNIFVEGRMA